MFGDVVYGCLTCVLHRFTVVTEGVRLDADGLMCAVAYLTYSPRPQVSSLRTHVSFLHKVYIRFSVVTEGGWCGMSTRVVWFCFGVRRGVKLFWGLDLGD